MMLLRRLWLIVPIGAIVTLLWIDRVHLQRAWYVSDLPEWSAAAPRPDPVSPTGYADGRRRLIVPGHHNASYQWIAQTQQMLAKGEWRVRRVDYENVPAGRDVHSASPYRWWLGLVAEIDRLFSGRPPGLAVEHAALFADPLWHLWLVSSAVAFAAWRFGCLSAALLSVALIGAFPFAASFLPGVPEQHGLEQTGACWSVLLLLAGWGARQNPAGDSDAARLETRRWFFLAGVAGGLGLWINVSVQLPILIGVALGGFVTAILSRRQTAADTIAPLVTPPWRQWALGGALASAGGYLLEYFPSRPGWPRIEVIHPLVSIAWLGGGELLARIVARLQGQPTTTRARNFWIMGGATLAILALPAALVLGKIENNSANGGSPAKLNVQTIRQSLTPWNDPFPERLTDRTEISAENVGAWITHDDFTAAATATLLPALLIVPAIFLIVRRQTDPIRRDALVLALGPVALAGVIAWGHLRWWSLLDSALLCLVVAGTANFCGSQPLRRAGWWWAGLVALMVIPGVHALSVIAGENPKDNRTLTQTEVESYVERDLAHWLADRAGPERAVVLASPNLTTTLCFHGGLGGISTLNWENSEGLFATTRMVRATSPEEAQTLLSGRGIKYIVLASWDESLDVFTRLNAGGAAQQANVPFLVALKQWDLPLWVRPLAYPLPATGGFAGSVTVFQIVDEQDTATAASRLAEYFIAIKQLDLATALREPLRGFPRNVGALVALAQIESARRDPESVSRIIPILLPLLTRGADRTLPWDRRVALAIVLTQGKQRDVSREQVRRCVNEMTETKLRSLNGSSLFQLQQLCTHFEIAITDPKLRELMRILSGPETSG